MKKTTKTKKKPLTEKPPIPKEKVFYFSRWNQAAETDTYMLFDSPEEAAEDACNEDLIYECRPIGKAAIPNDPQPLYVPFK
jgi:hypothetical protein